MNKLFVVLTLIILSAFITVQAKGTPLFLPKKKEKDAAPLIAKTENESTSQKNSTNEENLNNSSITSG
jgi:hypothetical protein